MTATSLMTMGAPGDYHMGYMLPTVLPEWG